MVFMVLKLHISKSSDKIAQTCQSITTVIHLYDFKTTQKLRPNSTLLFLKLHVSTAAQISRGKVSL